MSRKGSSAGRKTAGVLIRALGIILVAAVIISLALPYIFDFMGYETFHIVSDSMEPTIHVGSLVLVQRTSVGDVAAGDIIAFRSRGTVITHRVVEVIEDEEKLITRGDANSAEDPFKTAFSDVIGTVVRTFPGLGTFYDSAASLAGRIVLLGFIAAGLTLIGCGSSLTRDTPRKRS